MSPLPMWLVYDLTGLILLILPGPLDWLNYRLTRHHTDGSLGCGLIVAALVMFAFGYAETFR